MTYSECCGIFGITDILSLPAAAMSAVTGDNERRHTVYRALLEANGFDVSRDWFQEIYEAEMSEGKRKGQHFTPEAIYELLPQLVGEEMNTLHEPTAGTGGLIIGAWWRQCSRKMPWEYKPSQMRVCAWELSDRAVPLLLLNLSIRGIVGDVYHGDVLEQKVIARYRLSNPSNDALGFSTVTELTREKNE